MVKNKKESKFNALKKAEIEKLISVLDVNSVFNGDRLIYLMAKTGIRFSEALGVTPQDFDFEEHTLSINKVWDRRRKEFKGVKTKAENRTVKLDSEASGKFEEIIKGMAQDERVFSDDIDYNASAEESCRAAGVPVVSVFGIRHSYLLANGV
ncbi:MAG: tyrosine-type recombinase/integrase [Eubacterium sp.]|nr:tyrosine-type recombinase/integrase [Eubacterium sp.]